MAETEVTRNLSEIDAKLKTIGANLKSCTADSKALDKALKLDPTNTTLEATKVSVLKTQIDESQKKLVLLKQKQAEYDAQVKAGLPVDQREYQKLNVQIATTEASISSAQKQTSALNQQKLSGLKTAFAGVAKVATALLAAIVACEVAFVKEGNEVQTNADKLGVSAEEYQYMSNVFKETTGNADDYGTAMKAVTTVLAGISKGSTKSAEALASLGLTIDDLKGKSPTEALEIIRQALSKVTDEEERTVLATALLGDGGTALAQVAGLTDSQIAQLNADLAENGLMTNSEAASAKETAKILGNLKTAYQEVAVKLAVAFLPLVQTTAEALKNAIPFFTGIANGLKAIGPAGQIAAVGALAFLAALPGLITGIGSLKVGLDALASNPVMAAIAGVVAVGAIAAGAALLSSGIAGAISGYAGTASSSTTTSTTSTDNSTTNVYVTTDADPDEIASAIAAKKAQRGY